MAQQDLPGISDLPVFIIWHDAHAGTTHWEHTDELTDDDPYEVHTIGFLLNTKQGGKKNHVSVAQSCSPEGYVDSLIHIPKKMVVKTIPLERPADEPKRPNSQNNSAIS